MTNSSPWSTIILIALMVLAFYLLILRPQKRRQLAQQQTLNALEPEARVLLGSGLFGTIVSLGDKQAVLEISPGSELTVLKQAIVRVVNDSDEDLLDTAEEDASDEDELEDFETTESTGSGSGLTSPADPESPSRPASAEQDRHLGTNPPPNRD